MKNLLFIILTPFLAYSQEKGTNIIKVQPIEFNRVVSALLDQGYLLEKVDKEFQTIKTEPKEMKTNGFIRLFIRVKDSTAIISGDCGITQQALFDKRGFYGKVENKGMNGSLLKDSFNAMRDFALSLNGEILYTKEH